MTSTAGTPLLGLTITPWLSSARTRGALGPVAAAGLPETSSHAQYLAKPLANVDTNHVAFTELGGQPRLG